jgi:hypothetical protein
MNKRNSIALLIGGIVLITLLVFFTSGDSAPTKEIAAESEGLVVKKSTKKTKQPKTKKIKKALYKSSHWKRSYKINAHNPFDLLIFRKILYKALPTKETVVFNHKQFKKISSDTNALFLFVGKRLVMKQTDLDKLLNSVYKGSSLFIATDGFSKNITSLVEEENINLNYIFIDKVKVKANGFEQNFASVFQNDTVAAIWPVFQDETQTYASTLNGFGNMKFIQHGKGTILLHTSPVLFTNYQMEKYGGFKQLEYVLSYLPKKHKIWLEFVKNTNLEGDSKPVRSPNDMETDSYRKNSSTSAKVEGDSELLKMIFSSIALKTAYFLTIMGVVLFLIFRTKRLRPAVAVLEKEEDGTKNYTETLARIYEVKSTPNALLEVIRTNFYTQINRVFGIDLNLAKGEDIAFLAERCNATLEQIDSLILKLNPKQSALVTHDYLIEVAKQKRAFYALAGIISKSELEKEQLNFMIRREMLLPSIILLVSTLIGFLALFSLASKLGVGVGLIPLAFFGFYLGARMLNLPLIISTKEEIIFPQLLRKSVAFKRDQLTSFEIATNHVVFTFAQSSIRISQAQVSKIDRHLLHLFNSKSNTL